MNRSSAFFLVSLLCSCGLAMGITPAKEKAVSPAGSKPNIVFVLVDDMGWGDLGVFFQDARAKAKNPSQPAFLTPNLTSLAQEGAQLRRHYSGAPVCAPSRASLLSGRHQGNARVVRDNTFDYPLEDTQTLGSVLKFAGYATAIVGKWGVGGGQESAGDYQSSSAYPTKRGFDFFFGYLDHVAGHNHYPTTDPQRGPDKKTAVFDCEGDKEKEIVSQCEGAYSTDLFTARAKKWIVDQNKKDPKKPFFLYLAYTAPHGALQIPAQAYPAGGGKTGGVQWLGKSGKIINTADGKNKDTFIYPEFAAATYDHDGNPATAEVAWPIPAQRHASMLRRVDDGVKDIEALLKDLNIEGNTLIVFTSDNGPHNEGGAGGKWGQDPCFFDSYGPYDGIKRDLLEGGHRVPTLVKWPQHIKAGTVDSTPGQFHDWMATFADAAGVPVPASCDGVSLLPSMTGAGERKGSTIYTEYCHGGKTPSYKAFDPSHRGSPRDQQQIILVDGYKGIRTGIKSHEDDFQIFDVEKDTHEAKNLGGEPGFDKLQQKMKDEVLRVRRVYDYQWKGRGLPGSTSRPYDNALVPSVAVADTRPGLIYRVAEGRFDWVPEMDTVRKVAGQGTSSGVKIPLKANASGAVDFEGYIEVPADGEYVFYLTTDKGKGSKAFLRMHGMQLVDADNAYAPGTTVDSSAATATTEAGDKAGIHPTVFLKAGKHPIRLGYVRAAGSEKPSLKLEWQTPGASEKTELPESVFFFSK